MLRKSLDAGRVLLAAIRMTRDRRRTEFKTPSRAFESGAHGLRPRRLISICCFNLESINLINLLFNLRSHCHTHVRQTHNRIRTLRLKRKTTSLTAANRQHLDATAEGNLHSLIPDRRQLVQSVFSASPARDTTSRRRPATIGGPSGSTLAG